MRIFPLLLVALLAGCAPRAPDISIHDAWARATAPGQSSAAIYADIQNNGGDDRLVRVSSATGMAMLHGNESDNGVARMRMIATLPVPASTGARLSPGGEHVMLTGLKAPLSPGDRLQLTFRFATAGSRTVDVAIVAAGAR